MSELDRFKQTYFQECAELLEELEEQLNTAQDEGGDTEIANAIFRAVHSIKGGGGAFGFTALVDFAHFFETVLDKVRDGEIGFTGDVVDVCLRCSDALADLVAAAREGGEADTASVARARAELVELNGGDDHASQAPGGDFDDLDFTPVAVNVDGDEDDNDEGDEDARWRIRFRPYPSLLERGIEPLLMLRELAGLGDITTVAHVDDLPDLAAFDPTDVFLAWEIFVDPSVELAKIEEVFDFAVGDCELEIEREAGDESADEDGGDLALDLDAGGMSLEDMLDAALAEDASGGDEPEPKPKGEAAAASDGEPAGELAADPEGDPKQAAPARAEKAARKPTDKPASATKGAGATTIRVDLDRVDRVSDMASEIVITQASLLQQVDEELKQSNPELARGLEVLTQQTRMLQDAIMSIRAQPVKSVFSRMPRLIRQLEDEVGKKVRLEMQGESTEIDRTIIEQLADPLTHMIRNSVDHGIESAEDRIAAGKSPDGTIILSAEQVSGRIVIKIIDDGGGIRRDKVLKRAKERGLAAPDASLSDEEIDNLIFQPGFSTAETTSNISGRGVGMDVVRSNIERLGGRVSVRSNPGKGAVIVLSLPLTLAVLDVMVVRVGAQPYVIPLSSVIESMTLTNAPLSSLPSGEQMVMFRGEYVRIADLAVLLGETAKPDEERFLIMCDAEGDRRLGLLVDAMLGQQQVAIKSLESNFGRVNGLAGATIMGDGQVALIVDVVGIQRMLGAGASAGEAAAA